MGQTNTKEPQQHLPPKELDCTFVAARDNHVVVTHGETLLCQYDYSYPTEQELQKAVSKYQSGRSISHAHIQNLLYHSAKHINTFCSAIYRLSVYYEYCEQTLLSQITARKEEGNRYFEQKELWSILCSCTLAFSYLQSQNVYYNGLTLQDIWLTEHGVIKVNHPLNLTNNDPYMFNEEFFYAPEQLRPPENSIHLNHHKSEVYQLGLVLLRCCNLEDERSFYDGDRVNQSVIGELLLKAATKYDEGFINTLIAILREKPEERPRWNELENVIVNSVAATNRKKSQVRFVQGSEQSSPSECLHHISYAIHHNTQPALNLAEETQDQPQTANIQPQHEIQVIDEVPSRIPLHMKNSSASIIVTQSEDLGTARQNTSRIEEIIELKASNVLRKSKKDNTPPPYSADSNFKQQCQSSPSCFQPPSTGNKSSPRILSESIKDQRGRYEGQTQDGLRHGYGTFYYSEGGIYTGEWVKGEMHGKGAIYYPSGKMAYEGEWRHDKLHGKGILYNEEVVKLNKKFDHRDFGQLADYWVKYQGNFDSDNKSGRGKLVLSNGEYYVGEFKDDEVDGKGRFCRTDGTVVKGTWRSNTQQ